MREFISKVQQMRKSNGYEVMDSIEIFYEADDELRFCIRIIWFRNNEGNFGC